MSDFKVFIEPECGCGSSLCEYTEECTSAANENRQQLADWHDLTHGLNLWASCTHEPCSILTDEFRSSH